MVISKPFKLNYKGRRGNPRAAGPGASPGTSPGSGRRRCRPPAARGAPSLSAAAIGCRRGGGGAWPRGAAGRRGAEPGCRARVGRPRAALPGPARPRRGAEPEAAPMSWVRRWAARSAGGVVSLASRPGKRRGLPRRDVRTGRGRRGGRAGFGRSSLAAV